MVSATGLILGRCRVAQNLEGGITFTLGAGAVARLANGQGSVQTTNKTDLKARTQIPHGDGRLRAAWAPNGGAWIFPERA